MKILHIMAAIGCCLIFGTAQAEKPAPEILKPIPVFQPEKGDLRPPNDDFENAERIPIEGGVATGNSIFATTQFNEPPHRAGTPPSNSHSIWFVWTAPGTGMASFTSAGSSFDSVMAVYQGTTLTNLTPIAANDDEAPPSIVTSRVEIPVSRGDTFYIALDTFGSGAGGEYIFTVDGPEPEQIICDDLTLSIFSPENNQRIGIERIVVQGGTNVIDSNQIDLVLVIDTSTSLAFNDPMDFRKQAALNLLDSIPAGIDARISLIAFEIDATLLVPLSSNTSRLRTSVNTLNQAGIATNIELGLQLAIDQLDERGRPEAGQFIVLFTDGTETAGDAIPVVESSPYIINTVYLGDPDTAGSQLLENIANLTSGAFSEVNDASQLPDLFAGALSSTLIDRVEVFSELEPDNIVIIPRSGLVLGTWIAPNILVNTDQGARTTIFARVLSDEILPCFFETQITVIGGAFPGPPISPGILPVLCAFPISLEQNPESGGVSYIFEWKNENLAQPIQVGPTNQPFSFIHDLDPGVNLNPGETWFCDIVSVDDQGNSATELRAGFDLGAGGGYDFTGWKLPGDSDFPTTGMVTIDNNNLDPLTTGTVLCAIPRPFAYDSDGGPVKYLFRWSSDGSDPSFTFGPTAQSWCTVYDCSTPDITFDPGETWTVEVVAIDDEFLVSRSVTGVYRIGEGGRVIFSGWIVN